MTRPDALKQPALTKVTTGAPMASLGDGVRIELPTKSAIVYATLREAVLDGTLAAGSRLNLTQIARQLGTSETPVREALNRLESERLVRVEPHAGFVVTEVSLADLIENLMLRRVVESLATRLAATVMTSADLETLRDYVDEMAALAEGGNWADYTAVNKQFHRAIIELCPLPVIRRTAIELWEVGERTRSLFVRQPSVGSNEEHRRMLDAIERQDIRALDELVRLQKSNSVAVAMHMIDSSGLKSADGAWGVDVEAFRAIEDQERGRPT